MRRKRNGWLFLALVGLAYGATAVIEPDRARDAFATFLPMLAKMLPALVLVFALMLLAELFLNPERVERWMGSHSGLRGWLLAIVAGMLSTGPAYAWYALLAALRAKGLRTAMLAVILYARAIKLPLLPLLAHYFGVRYAVVLSLFIAGFSVLSGLAMERIDKRPTA
ncbi:MAG: hypothetical protein J5I92_00585 [Thiogranum sp.]|nr:hypothetical protein [Thiogranum sp.]